MPLTGASLFRAYALGQDAEPSAPGGEAMKATGSTKSGWRWAQAASVFAAVGVVALLFLQPRMGLFVTWSVLIPLVPALLLIAPQVWRNLCPIAVVHQLPAMAGFAGRRELSARAQRIAPAVAAGLLLAIVPLRLVLFNHHGPALALFVLTVLAVALLSGLVVTGKAGWCATYCPVLPVERLYGQSPPLSIAHAHCGECTSCLHACYDINPRRSLAELLASDRPPRGAQPATGLHRSASGLFSAAFPGFVLGYFTVPPAFTVIETYGWIVGAATASLGLLLLFQRTISLPDRVMSRMAAAAAVCLYYWYCVPAVALAAHQTLDVGPAPAVVVAVARSAALALVAIWLLQAIYTRPRADNRALQAS